MRFAVTGSSGHLGEALVRVLSCQGHQVVGLDVVASRTTRLVGSVCDRDLAAAAVEGADAVIHAATLHKPHLASHDAREFIETNVSGTAVLLNAAADAGVGAFVFTSTTSAFGRALTPPEGQPAAWITEDVAPVAKNIYGVTKVAAEELCQVAYQTRRLPCVVLRIARFFPEDDDNDDVRSAFKSENAKVNELLYRRVDLADAVTACQRAAECSERIGFGRYIITATTPFSPNDLSELRVDAPRVVRRHYPDYEALYAAHGWRMFPALDRVYVNARAREALGWEPKHDFAWALERLGSGDDTRSALAIEIGAKGYHPDPTGVYTRTASHDRPPAHRQTRDE
jgi:nucleoside-diphosphate-sugar epimerase